MEFLRHHSLLINCMRCLVLCSVVTIHGIYNFIIKKDCHYGTVWALTHYIPLTHICIKLLNAWKAQWHIADVDLAAKLAVFLDISWSTYRLSWSFPRCAIKLQTLITHSSPPSKVRYSTIHNECALTFAMNDTTQQLGCSAVYHTCGHTAMCDHIPILVLVQCAWEKPPIDLFS